MSESKSKYILVSCFAGVYILLPYNSPVMKADFSLIRSILCLCSLQEYMSFRA